MLCAKNYEDNTFSFTKTQIDFLCNLLNTKNPKNILEYWCWVTTKILNDYVKTDSMANYISIEHDKKYKLNDHVHIFKLVDDPNIKSNLYEWLEYYIQSLDKKFDFIIIDGPFWWDLKYNYTRLQMIDPILYDKLADEWFILIHDSQRESTIKSIEILKTLLILKWYYIIIDYISYDEEKELMIIEFSKKNWLKDERIKFNRKFTKRKRQKFLYKIINYIKNFIRF